MQTVLLLDSHTKSITRSWFDREELSLRPIKVSQPEVLFTPRLFCQSRSVTVLLLVPPSSARRKFPLSLKKSDSYFSLLFLQVIRACFSQAGVTSLYQGVGKPELCRIPVLCCICAGVWHLSFWSSLTVVDASSFLSVLYVRLALPSTIISPR